MRAGTHSVSHGKQKLSNKIYLTCWEKENTDEQIYPFDSGCLLSKRKQIRRELLESCGEWIDKKIAMLGGSTTHDIKDMLELFLLNYGIRAQFSESEYTQYWQVRD